MPAAIPVIIGQRFARLVVVRELERNRFGQRMVECLCDCGNYKKVNYGSLRNGSIRSCTCLRDEVARLPTTHGHSTGGKQSGEYTIWQLMKRRCHNPANDSEQIHYAGRGIEVCERWRGFHGFENFLADVGPRPSAKHEIDRWPDPNGNYEPGNVRWATRAEQTRNTNSNVFITINGRTLCMADWAKEAGVTPPTIRYRYLAGWKPEEIILPAQSRSRRSK